LDLRRSSISIDETAFKTNEAFKSQLNNQRAIKLELVTKNVHQHLLVFFLQYHHPTKIVFANISAAIAMAQLSKVFISTILPVSARYKRNNVIIIAIVLPTKKPKKV